MMRRDFLSAVAAGAAGASDPASAAAVVIERTASNQLHKGKVLALVTPHLDDGPIFAGGAIAKLLREGYTGYFIRTSNDEKDSFDLSPGETMLANERDTGAMVKALGLRQSFDLGYRNHRMDDVARIELRSRLIFLFRLLKVDTVFSYDPWGHYEENPDHYVTAQAVEAACWMAGGRLDYTEHFAAGLKPHAVSEKYYFARGPQLVNRAVDIGPVLETKYAVIQACRTMIAHMVQDVNTALAERRLRLPLFSGDRERASEEFITRVFRNRDEQAGRRYGLSSAEEFHYIGPDTSLDDYISRNAVPL